MTNTEPDALYGLPELVRNSRLQARFWSDGSQHYVANCRPSETQPSPSEEVWTQVKHLGTASGGSITLQSKVSAEGGEPQLRAVKCIRTGDASAGRDEELYLRKLEAIVKFSQEGACPDGSLPQDQARDITTQLLHALVFLHAEQFFHGDLKPSNILIKSRHPDPWKIKLANFGVDKNGRHTTPSIMSHEKPRFKAPETFGFTGRDENTDPFAADMWCLGEVLFEMLCGRPAFSDFAELTEYIYGDGACIESGLEASSIGNVGISLVTGLLAGEASRRLTAEDAARHPWNNPEPADIEAGSSDRISSPSMSLLSEWSWSKDAPNILSVIVHESADPVEPAHQDQDRSQTPNEALEALSEYGDDGTTEQLAKVTVHQPQIIPEEGRDRSSRHASWISQIPTLSIREEEQQVRSTRPESTDISLKNEPTKLPNKSRLLWHNAMRSIDKTTLKHRMHERWVERETERLCRHITNWRIMSLDKNEEANLLTSMSELVQILLKDGRADFAVQLFRDTVVIRERVAGSKDRTMVHAMDHLATIFMEKGVWDTAAEILEHSLEAKKSMLHKGSNIAWGTNQLIYALSNASRLVEPEVTCQLLVELGEKLLQTISQASTPEKHGFYTSKEGYHEAEQVFQTAMKLSKAAFGIKHKTLPSIMDRIALCLSVQNKVNEAERVYLLTLRLKDEMLGRKHPSTLETMEALATMLRSHNKLASAAAFFRYLTDLRRNTLGPKHPRSLASMHDLGETFYLQKKYIEAEALHEETLLARRRLLGAEHPDTIKTLHHLGADFLGQSRYAEAEKMFQEAAEARFRILGEYHPETLQSMNCTILARNRQKGGSKTRNFIRNSIT